MLASAFAGLGKDLKNVCVSEFCRCAVLQLCDNLICMHYCWFVSVHVCAYDVVSACVVYTVQEPV